jgi:hypothetical protein
MCTNVHWCTPMHTNAHQCTPMCTNANWCHWCTPMHTTVHQCILMSPMCTIIITLVIHDGLARSFEELHLPYKGNKRCVLWKEGVSSKRKVCCVLWKEGVSSKRKVYPIIITLVIHHELARSFEELHLPYKGLRGTVGLGSGLVSSPLHISW